ncbi:DUF547 domain-containing protein [candidate division KSB1 bacterium]|nr:DUF547 domain-containing protein [candidate division KSB1 bacterium]
MSLMMMRLLRHVSFVLLFFASLIQAQHHSANFFQQADGFFSRHVRPGLVEYATIKKNPDELKALVVALANFDLKALGGGHAEKAFWINAYNLLVIHTVVTHYPIKSPMDVPGFFDRAQHRVAGDSLTLNEIENNKLREKYGDARIHFALVCAAKGCPELINQAYFAKDLGERLNIQTRAALNNFKHVRVSLATKQVLVSEIFKWYETDFTSKGKTVIDYINQYRSEKFPADFSIGYIPYDWTLNDLSSQ